MDRIVNTWYEKLNSRSSVRVNLFTSALYSFLLFKILILFPIAEDIADYHRYHSASLIKKLLVAPAAVFFCDYPISFLSVCVILVVGLIFIKRTFLFNALGFWIGMNIIQASEPVANGSDYVLALMLLLSIPLTHKPLRWKWNDYQPLIFDSAVILIQIHVALIYLVSGFDKLLSESWRSGKVMINIAELDYFAHPILMSLQSSAINSTIAWFTILFELAFPVFIWFNIARMPLLIIGVIFHIGIIVFLNLPDFGLMMIICYAIFLHAKGKSVHENESTSFA